jgi:hypothetical protein
LPAKAAVATASDTQDCAAAADTCCAAATAAATTTAGGIDEHVSRCLAVTAVDTVAARRPAGATAAAGATEANSTIRIGGVDARSAANAGLTNNNIERFSRGNANHTCHQFASRTIAAPGAVYA